MKAVAAFLLVLCHLAISHAWTCEVAPPLPNVVQVDAGQGNVVATDKDGFIYFLTGSSWIKMSSLSFKHSSVGPAGLWATGQDDQVYKFVGGNFQRTSGQSLKQIDAGGAGQVVGVTSADNGYCLTSVYASAYSGKGSLSWQPLSRGLIYISCGPIYGCWGIDSVDNIYVTQETLASTCADSSWSLIQGAAVMVEVATDGSVFVINRSGLLYQRLGIAGNIKQGSSWAQIPMCTTVRHVSYDLGILWVVTKSGLLLKCTE